MRVLLDTNIILDFFLEREPFFQDASRLFETIADSQLEGFVTASSATDIFYICKRQTQDLQASRQILTKMLALLSVSAVDRTILETALNSGLADFEDAVQLACAEVHHLDAVITRNPDDFRAATLPVMSVEQLMTQL